MIVADSSAILAMIFREPEADNFYRIISNANATAISAVTCYEVAVVLLARHGPAVFAREQSFLERGNFEIVPFTRESYLAAADAYRKFGKGMGKRPHLNFGDCVSYALANSLNAPLLYKGNDFSVTGIATCV
ncbi:MAG: type II toxin-antitoxin system VapC family toxin [Rhizobiales bacterium]|nr:type II toxin-antitoxin system VapC family toxin [Hyphomicrobiales bacterium]